MDLLKNILKLIFNELYIYIKISNRGIKNLLGMKRIKEGNRSLFVKIKIVINSLMLFRHLKFN